MSTRAEDLAAAMARPLRSGRLAGSSRSPLQTDADLEGHYGDAAYRPWLPDEPISDEVMAAGEAQDAEAERLFVHEYDPDEREMFGGDPYWREDPR